MTDSIQIRPERPSDAATVDELQKAVFGPGAYTRAAFRVREQAGHDPAMSFVAILGGRLIGSVRLTPIAVGAEHRGFLLGPLMVEPAYKNLGHGRALLRHAVEEARAAGHGFIILVGDPPYYGPFGFVPIPRGRVRMPGPVDPGRLLVAELSPGALDGIEGTVRGIPLPGQDAA